jgi:GNAT superfamily N-acetyltransferase
MEIRKPDEHEKNEIVQLYKKVQLLTGIPNPDYVSPDDLEGRIYSERAIERYVIDHLGRIAGHALIELPDPGHVDVWKAAIGTDAQSTMIELGGAFVDPTLKGLGVWTALLKHRLEVINEIDAIPVSATWTQNHHVKRTFQKYGGEEVGRQRLPAGEVSLFVFSRRD